MDIEVLLKAAEYLERQECPSDGSQSSCSSLSSSLSSCSSLPGQERPKIIRKLNRHQLIGDAINDLSKSNVFKLRNIDISSCKDDVEFQAVSPLDLGDAHYNDNDVKSPRFNSASPSSFSCSSSSSSLYSLPQMSSMGADTETPNDEKCKPDDLKRNKLIHNILEKNRRAHLKDCFENLQYELPQYRDKKVTNLLILKQTIKYLEHSKRVESEYESELKRLVNCKAELTNKLKRLQNDLGVTQAL